MNMQMSKLWVFKFSRFPFINNKSDCIKHCRVFGLKFTMDEPTFYKSLANNLIDISDTFIFLSRQNYAATELDEKYTGETDIISTILGEGC